MKLSEIKNHLEKANTVNFKLPNGSLVPEHFHVTEVGMIHKTFIDCGGTLRNEKMINFQLWNANDTDHKLKPEKLKRIIELSEKVLGLEDLEIEVEYQSDTIGKYALAHNGTDFVLVSKQTDCLAKDNCGVPSEKKKVSLSELSQTKEACCSTNDKNKEEACCNVSSESAKENCGCNATVQNEINSSNQNPKTVCC